MMQRSPAHPNFARRLAILAVALMIASAVCFRPGAGDGELTLAVVFMLVGGATLGGAYYFTPQIGEGEKIGSRAVLKSPRYATERGFRGEVILAAAGVICLMVMAEGNSPRGTMHFHTQFVLWCVGIVLVTVGMSGVWRVNLTPRPPLQSGEGEKARSRAVLKSPLYAMERGFRGEVWTVLGLTLLAFLLRTVALETFVHHFVDELNFTDAIVQLWDTHRDINILTRHGFITSFPWIYPYFQAISVEIVGPSLAAMRLVSVIFGTLTIPALYLLAKHLFDWRTALLAALLLATFPPHIHFSRLGMNNIVDPFFGTLALAFLARAFHTHNRRDWALAGAALGLTQYFYEGGKLIFPLLALALVIVMVIRRNSPENKRFNAKSQRAQSRKEPLTQRHRETQRFDPIMSWRAWRLGGSIFYPFDLPPRTPWRGIGIFVLTACLVVAPLYDTLLVWHSSYLPRVEAQQVGSDYWATLLTGGSGLEQIRSYFDQQLKPALLHFIHLPDTNRAFYGGETGLILPYLVPFFLLGMFHLLWRWRKAAAVLLPWVLLTAFGNSLLKDPAWSARFVVALPALPLIVAVGIRDTWVLVFPLLNLTPRPPLQSGEGKHDSSQEQLIVPRGDVGTRSIVSARTAWIPSLNLTPRPPLQSGKGEHDSSQEQLKSPLYAMERGFRGEVYGAIHDDVQLPDRQHTAAFLKIILAALIAFQVAYYFGPHLRLFNSQVRYTRDQYDVMYRVRDFPPGTHVFILGDEVAYPPHNAILSQFWHLDLHIQSRHPLELMLWGLHRLPGDDDIAFFIEPDDPATLDYLANIFDLQGPFYSPYNIPRDRQYVLYYVSRRKSE